MTSYERQRQGWPPNEIAVDPDVPFAFPASQTFGDDWIVYGLYAETPSNQGLMAYTARYSSVFGSFSTITVTPYFGILSDGLTATQEADARLDYYRPYIRPLGNVEEDERPTQLALNRLPPPDGCTETSRLEGRDYLTNQDVGITLCQSDTIDAMIVVMVIGELSYYPEYEPGLNQLEYSERSDFVASAVVTTISESGGISEPAGTPASQ